MMSFTVFLCCHFPTKRVRLPGDGGLRQKRRNTEFSVWGRGGANIQLNNNRKRRCKNNKKHYKNEYRNNTTTTATTTTIYANSRCGGGGC